MNRAKILMSRSSLYTAVTLILLAVFGFGLAITNNAQAAKDNAGNEALATPAFTEGFEDIETLEGKGWVRQNNSVPLGTSGWFQGTPAAFAAQAGPANSYISANFNNTATMGTINNWLLTPVIEFRTGDVISFYTRTRDGAPFADRLQVRISTAGASTNVGTGLLAEPTDGDFRTKVLDINPTYVEGPTGYPDVWTKYTITITGVTGMVTGRLAFRYFVEDGGFTGANSYQIGIDTFAYTPAAAGCTYSINPSSLSSPAAGGAGSFNVVTQAGCAFTAVSNSPFIVINSGTGTGNGIVSFTIAANTGPSRTGTITVAGQTFTVTQAAGTAVIRDAPVDFNGDGKTDYVVVRNVGGASGTGTSPANQARWFYNINGSNAPTDARDWGLFPSDVFLSEDFDGDVKDDIAVWRPGAPTVAAFYILNSATNTVRVEMFGQTGDDPSVVGDYDNDNKADIAVYRPGATAGAQSVWFYRIAPNGATNSILWGIRGDVPAPGDYDGDGRHDFVIKRDNGDGRGQFWTRLATGVTTTPVRVFGLFSDKVVPGDYDGDGITDIATVRTTGGALQWFWRRSSDSVEVGPITFGTATDLPVQGDYDGDGTMDVAVWRNNGLFISRSTVSGAVAFFGLGANGDVPVANYNSH